MYIGSHPNLRQARKHPKDCKVNFFFISAKFFLTPLGFLFGGTWAVGLLDGSWCFSYVLFKDSKILNQRKKLAQYTNVPQSSQCVTSMFHCIVKLCQVWDYHMSYHVIQVNANIAQSPCSALSVLFVETLTASKHPPCPWCTHQR